MSLSKLLHPALQTLMREDAMPTRSWALLGSGKGATASTRAVNIPCLMNEQIKTSYNECGDKEKTEEAPSVWVAADFLSMRAINWMLGVKRGSGWIFHPPPHMQFAAGLLLLRGQGHNSVPWKDNVRPYWAYMWTLKNCFITMFFCPVNTRRRLFPAQLLCNIWHMKKWVKKYWQWHKNFDKNSKLSHFNCNIIQNIQRCTVLPVCLYQCFGSHEEPSETPVYSFSSVFQTTQQEDVSSMSLQRQSISWGDFFPKRREIGYQVSAWTWLHISSALVLCLNPNSLYHTKSTIIRRALFR